MYEKIEKNENIIVPKKISLMCHFVDGAFAELKNAEEGKEDLDYTLGGIVARSLGLDPDLIHQINREKP